MVQTQAPTTRPQNGFAIRDFRVARGLSVDELANRTQISAPHVRNIENELKDASELHLSRIALALEVRVASLRRQPLAATAEQVAV